MFATLVAGIAEKFSLDSQGAERVVRSVLGFLQGAPQGIPGLAAHLAGLGFPPPPESWAEAAAPVLDADQATALVGDGVVAPLAQTLHKDKAEAATALGFTLPKVLGLIADHGAVPGTLPAAAQAFLKGPASPAGLAPDRLVDSRIGDWVVRGLIFFGVLGILCWLTPRGWLPPVPAGSAPAASPGPAASGTHGAAHEAAPAAHGAAPAAGGHAAAPATAPSAAAASGHGATASTTLPAPASAAPAPGAGHTSAQPAPTPAPAGAAPGGQATVPAAPASTGLAPQVNPPALRPARLTLRQIGDTYYYGGSVPDATVAEKVRAIIGAAFGVDKVKGDVAVDPRAAAPGWPDRLAAILGALQTQGFNLALDDSGLTFRALAPDADRAALQARLSSLLAGGSLALPDLSAPRLDAAAARTALDGLAAGYRGADVAKTLNLVAIEFDTASADVPADDKSVLVKAATLIKALPNGAVVVIEGYTDNVGDADANLALSQRRADAVKAIMVGAGLDPDSITATGYGEANPVASNDSDDGRSHNRRITYEVRPR